MASVKGNIVLNIINTITGLLFPLITFPYVSRILRPEGIGQIQFYQSIINYIVLLSAIGIPLYAAREIARLRDNIAILKKTTLEILILHGILSVLGYVIVFILCFTVGKIKSDWILFLILSISIIFNVIGVQWFYQAIEEFKYITIRSIIVRCISLISLFIFVHSPSDLYIYAIILVGGQVGNYGLNFYRLRKYNIFKELSIKDLSIKKHLFASLKIFMLNVAISLYININPIMLGFLTDDIYVGYYTAATRIINAINGITTAIGTVILPRLSNYYAVGKLYDYNKLKNKVLNLINLLCLPLSICLMAIAPIIIPVFAGEEYSLAITTLMISAPTVIISALNYIIGIQILYTQKKEHLVIIATSIGGLVNIILNIILIPRFLQNGAAISGLLAEVTVLVICYILGYKNINYNLINRNNAEALIISILCGVVCFLTNTSSLSKVSILIIDIISSVTIYLILLLILQNKLIIEYKNIFLAKIKIYI